MSASVNWFKTCCASITLRARLVDSAGATFVAPPPLSPLDLTDNHVQGTVRAASGSA